MRHNPHVLFTFDKAHNPLRLPRHTTSERPKVVRTCGVFSNELKICFLPQRACTFQQRNFLVCFVRFDLEMCFGPQRRALFLTAQLPEVLRCCGVLRILTWKFASCDSGVHFLDIATSKSIPNMCFLLAF